MSAKRGGFTLIELLIVVAIIAILAMIAVPNFLEAQTRSKCARVVADMRTFATAIEAYCVDVNDYPRNNRHRFWTLSVDLTTPVAYLATVTLTDPFSLYKENDPLVGLPYYTYHRVLSLAEAVAVSARNPNYIPAYESVDGPDPYNPGAESKYGAWRLLSLGPDRDYLPIFFSGSSRAVKYQNIDMLYDPTNGTVSWGNLMRTHISPDGKVR